ncbi:hypothetical protein ACFLU6_03770 [Acidobacteriota bacterium]
MPAKRTKTVPGIFQKQAELYLKPLPADQLEQTGRFLEDEGLTIDAVEYYRIAGETGSLNRLKQQALSDGDLFYYLLVCKALDAAPVREELQQLSRSAQSNGKDAYAEKSEKVMTEMENQRA